MSNHEIQAAAIISRRNPREGTEQFMGNVVDDFDRRVHVYEQLMDCMPDAAAALDLEGVLFFVNRRACELSGYAAEELIGSSFGRLLDPSDLDPVAAQVFRTLRTGMPVKGFKTRIRRKDGDTRIISFTLDPLTESGQITGAIGTAEDVTSREHADRQYRLLESVVLNAREPIVITAAEPVDPPGPRIQFVNRAFTQMTAYDAEEILGRTPSLLHGPHTEPAVLEEIRNAVVHKAPVQVELVNYRKDHSEYWTNLSIMPVADHLVGFHVDITERRRREITLERRLAEANRRLEEGALTDLFPGHEPATRYLRQQIVEAAPSRRLPVLILGERGTGKALVAHEIHRQSDRAARPFVAVDCTAIPAPLFESEMFGHEKGAFTGAMAIKRGLFQQADGGSLFLDEIGELSLEQQAKLLVAIQERVIRRVGGTLAIPIDVRIIAATNRDLDQMVADGRFRADLYDRLRGFLIEVPPLRDREADLDLYVDRFVARWCEEEGKAIVDVEPGVVEAFRRYSWPGNVRELEFVVGRMVARARGDRLTVELLPGEISGRRIGATPVNPPGAADVIERGSGPRRELSKTEIEQALKQHNGIVRRAARELGIARNTLYRLIEKHGIQHR
jgi:PAS domain S-box-containing protein